MFIVTGGAGFIGSNLVAALNRRGEDDILVVDDLTNGRKFQNLAGLRIADYLDRDEFRRRVRAGESLGPVRCVFHQGACSDTTNWDGRFMLDVNFEAAKEIFAWCQARRAPLVYASSGAVYGGSTAFAEDQQELRPLNVYGWSKLLFDRYVERRMGELVAPVAGLRYFNVYGPREGHKARMASVIHRFRGQIEESGRLHLFAGSHGYGDGEHRRDFVYVGDVAAVNLWCFDRGVTGIFNVGTGRSRSFNDVARAVIGEAGRGEIAYNPLPDDLVGVYQAFTEADISKLRAAGYDAPFVDVDEGVRLALAPG